MNQECEACHRDYLACDYAPNRKHFLCSGNCIIMFKKGKVKCKACMKNWKLKNQITCKECHDKIEVMEI